MIQTHTTEQNYLKGISDLIVGSVKPEGNRKKSPAENLGDKLDCGFLWRPWQIRHVDVRDSIRSDNWHRPKLSSSSMTTDLL